MTAIASSSSSSALPGGRWSRLARAGALPLALLAAWQLWTLSLPANSPAPAPLRVLSSAIELIANGGLPWALTQSLARVL
ncbi:MAG: hypothetical protein J7603_01205, partial [Pseudacidovorax sp.]|nr:hypothetical protein [Pseudacidovorax sp.]